MKELWLAFGFLTVLPVRQVVVAPGDLGRAGRWFPLVGIVIGALLLAVYLLCQMLFRPVLAGQLLAATVVTATWAALTGGLHLDGLADCCDGLLAATSPERRLAIMRDPRTGAFAVIGIVFFLLLKVTAVASLTTGLLPSVALLLAPTWARWLILLAARRPAARPEGLGVEFATGLSAGRLGVALIIALLPLALAGGWQTLLQAGVGLLLAWLSTLWLLRLARRRLGGVTGDVFGLVVEVAELAVLLGFAINL